MVSQQRFHSRGCLVSASEPDDSRRWPEVRRQICKVRVLTDDCKTVGPGILPNLAVRGPVETESEDLRGLGKEIGEVRRRVSN